MISVIIVSYKSDEEIGRCLTSIASNNDVGDDLEVIVVDSSPYGEVARICENHRILLPRVTYIPNPANGGFGQANNIGAVASNGNVLFFLNPDTVIVEPIFRLLRDTFAENPMRIVGFRLVARDGRPQHSFGFMPEINWLWMPRRLANFLVFKMRLFSGQIYPWGAAFALQRSNFERAGMFDEDIFLCYEEPDLVHRLPDSQVTMIDRPIVHLEGHGETASLSRLRAQFQSAKHYFAKHRFSFGRFLTRAYINTSLKSIVKKLFFLEVEFEYKVMVIIRENLKKKG